MATLQVGHHVHSVAWAAEELGVAWHTVMDALNLWGAALVDDAERVGPTRAIGVDETSFLAATATEGTRWVSSICDVDGRNVIDLIEGRQGPSWTNRWPSGPRAGRTAWPWPCATCTSPSGRHWASTSPTPLPGPDPFHVVAVGTRCLNATRRRTQNETLGHRGHKGDPLYRCLKLLAMSKERLDQVGTAKLRGLLAAGDPFGEVHQALRCTTSVRWPRSTPSWSMSAPSTSEMRSPFIARSDHRARSRGDESPAATRNAPSSLRLRPTYGAQNSPTRRGTRSPGEDAERARPGSAR